MANTSPTVDNVPVLEDILQRAKAEDIRIYQAASISHSLKGETLTDMKALKEAGACGFTDDGIPLKNAAFCYKAMEEAAALNVPISFTKKTLHLLRTTESIMVMCLKSWVYMALLLLLKSLWLPAIVCLLFAPVQTLLSSTSAPDVC